MRSVHVASGQRGFGRTHQVSDISGGTGGCSRSEGRESGKGQRHGASGYGLIAAPVGQAVPPVRLIRDVPASTVSVPGA